VEPEVRHPKNLRFRSLIGRFGNSLMDEEAGKFLTQTSPLGRESWQRETWYVFSSKSLAEEMEQHPTQQRRN
jgi:hypothetical protein